MNTTLIWTHLQVKNGSFEFTSKPEDSTWNQISETHHWIGQYDANTKHGEWHYQSERKDLEILSIESDHLNYALRTVESELKAYYKHDIPDKTWIYSSTQVENGKEKRPFVKMEVPFLKGKVHGTLNMVREGTLTESIQGACKHGLMDGEWTFVFHDNGTSVEEKRWYKKGILLRLIQWKNDDTVQNITFNHSPQTTAYLQTGKGGSHLTQSPYALEFNDGYPRSSIERMAQRSGNNLMDEALKYLLRFDKDYTKSKGLILGCNRGRYPLTPDEEKWSTNWYQWRKKLDDRVRHLEELRLQNYRLSTDSATVVLDYWLLRQKEILNITSSLTKTFFSGEVEYYYRSPGITSFR